MRRHAIYNLDNDTYLSKLSRLYYRYSSMRHIEASK